jgi:glycosyltransferase involved in cell wall biosynthesis
MPRVSVILTSFNHEKYLREAIESVLAQTYTDFELIIWDDFSSDNSWAIINSYSDPRIKVFRSEQTRRYVINRAIHEVASGEYIAIQHSDDIWEAEKLEKQVAFLDSHLEFGAVFTNALAIGEDSSLLNISEHTYSSIFDQPNRTRHQWLNHFFYHGNALCHPSVLIRKQCYENCGVYQQGLAQLPDFDMWIRLCFKYEIYVLPEKLVRFRVRDNEANTSGNRPDARIRVCTESHECLKNYLMVPSLDELIAIFPAAKKYTGKSCNQSNLHFIIAMLCLSEHVQPFFWMFGIDILFELFKDKSNAEQIKSNHEFDYLDLIRLTGERDLFSIEKVRVLQQTIFDRDAQITSLNEAVSRRDAQINSLNEAASRRDAQINSLNEAMTGRDAQINSLNEAVAERDAQITALLTSTSWRATALLRFIGHKMKRIKRL